VSARPAEPLRRGPQVDAATRVAALAVIGLAGALWSWAFFTYNQVPMLVGYHLVAWAFVVCGVLAWVRRPDNRTGLLLMVCGGLLGLLPMLGSAVPALGRLGAVFNSSFAPVLLYVVFAFPLGYLRSPYDRVLVAITAVIVLVQDPLAFAFRDRAPEVSAALYTAASVAVVVTAVGLIVPRLARRWWQATAPGRRVLGPLVLSTSVWLLAHAFIRFTDSIVRADWITAEVYHAFNQVVMASIPLAFLFGLYRARARRSRLGDLVVELGAVRSPERLQPALASTLGDPALAVGFWSPEQGCYLTAEGQPLELPHGRTEQVATFLESQGQRLAVIVHDRALLDDPRLVEASSTAARLAVENERLHAEIRAQLEAVRASRARIVQAGDAERRRVERNLHDGAQQRLITLTLQLRMLADALGPDADPVHLDLLERASEEARAAHRELRELAQGVHPSVLSDDGLAAALEFLAERATLPVVVDTPAGRFPESVEVTAYFVAAEALANTMKHAHAEAATISVTRSVRSLRVEVSDDGQGGADPDGAGLRGLADRVAAMRGTLTIESSPAAGTTVSAEIPCG
jgi:signal transduction histidine kinase